MSDDLAEIANGKTGVELFRELMRLYSEAQVEDYFKAGIWKDDLMRTDFSLIEAHRREAGAPNPPPLSEIPTPKLPQQQKLLGVIPGLNGAGSTVMQQFMSNGIKSSGLTATPEAEKRNAAIWISKNKLDPSKAKVLVMALTLDVRRKVMEGFSSDKIGLPAVEELEKFITAEKAKSGGGQSSPASTATTTPAPPKAPAKAVNGGIGGVAIDELKDVAKFIAKNKLDPASARAMLLAQTPAMRKSIMTDFTTTNTGPKAKDDLEKYIKQLKDSEASEPAAKKARVGS